MNHQGSRRYAPAPPNVDAEACGSVEELWQTSGALLGRLPPFRRVRSNPPVEGHEFPLPAAVGTINRHRGVNEWTKEGEHDLEQGRQRARNAVGRSVRVGDSQL